MLMQELMTVVKNMIRNTEIAVRTFMMLRPRFIHPKIPSSSTSATPQPSAGAIVPSSSSTQPMSSSAIPVVDFYSGIPKRPSPFLQQTVSRLEKDLCECQQRVEELEQLLLSNTNEKSLDSYSSLFQSLPKVMSNVHDFFVHVAAKVKFFMNLILFLLHCTFWYFEFLLVDRIWRLSNLLSSLMI